MAMNNWGGSKEHMSKKPKGFLSSRRIGKKVGKGSRQVLSKEKIISAQKKKQASVRKELAIYSFIFLLSILLVALYFRGI